MIQLNLLPDVKIAFIKARAQKRLVTLGSIIIGASALAIFILLFFYVNIVQTKSSNDLSADIKSSSDELTSTKDINKILTVQNQLISLDGVHNQKPAVDRLPGYIAKTTPESVDLKEFEVDFAAKTIKVNGKALTLDAVNGYIDTLKATKFSYEEDEKTVVKKAFSDVVLASFSRSDKEASFTATFTFDELIFDSQKEITLIIPQGQSGVVNNNAFGEEQ